MRHFYDIHQLFKQEQVRKFIETEDYSVHKEKRFRSKDIKDLKNNIAFNLESDAKLFELYNKRFSQNLALYYNGAPSFEEIYSSIIEIRKIG